MKLEEVHSSRLNTDLLSLFKQPHGQRNWEPISKQKQKQTNVPVATYTRDTYTEDAYKIVIHIFYSDSHRLLGIGSDASALAGLPPTNSVGSIFVLELRAFSQAIPLSHSLLSSPYRRPFLPHPGSLLSALDLDSGMAGWSMFSLSWYFLEFLSFEFPWHLGIFCGFIVNLILFRHFLRGQKHPFLCINLDLSW